MNRSFGSTSAPRTGRFVFPVRQLVAQALFALRPPARILQWHRFPRMRLFLHSRFHIESSRVLAAKKLGKDPSVILGQYPICRRVACPRVSRIMKQRAVTKRGPRQSSMAPRRKRSSLPAVSRKKTARVSSGGSSRPVTGRRRRVGEAAGKKRSSRRTTASAVSTTDHDEIRDWVESRGGHPATVKSTARGSQAAGVLRIDFPEFSGGRSLKAIEWDEWFEVFEENDLAFLYQPKGDSRFSKLVRRKK